MGTHDYRGLPGGVNNNPLEMRTKGDKEMAGNKVMV